MMKAAILIVDDEKTQREMLGRFLGKKGFDVLLASSGSEALDILGVKYVDIVISDQKMPGMSGLELASAVNKNYPTVSVMIVTAYGSIQGAVTAMKDNVEDYLTKPINLDELEAVLARIIEKKQLIHENEQLRERLEETARFPGIIYRSDEMRRVLSLVARTSASNATVLITGESGTGKELIARAIHDSGERKENAFIAVNCSAIPENLIESELFGHEKGAFTGADRKRTGRFEQAEGGTLFLDEIGDVPLSVQVKLLRVLQERTFERVGGNTPISADIRIISATNRDLEHEISEGRFRDDLFYRINVISIDIPPLKNRKADIPVLIEHYLSLFAAEHGKGNKIISAEAVNTLVKYSLPGNVRELANIIEQAVVLSREKTITLLDLPLRVSVESPPPGAEPVTLEDKIAKVERESLEKALLTTGGNKSAAARILGISEHKVRYLLKKHAADDSLL